MLNKFLNSVKVYHMINPGDRVLLAVSGGADSMCMLLLFLDASKSLGCTVSVAHVNHMIRGEAADLDEAFVRDFCRESNVPFYSEKINVPEIAKTTGKSLELAAREARYSFFSSLEFDKTATAHTRSDRVETMLMNLSRGSGLHGLTSIPPVRGKIIRPLIDFSREETEEYCRIHGVDFRVDETNSDTDYSRNRFRLNVIPDIMRVYPDCENKISSCISLLTQDDAYLSDVAGKEFDKLYDSERRSIDISSLKELHYSIKSRVVMKYFSLFPGADYERKHIDSVCSGSENKYSLTLPGGQCFICDGKYLKYLPRVEVHDSDEEIRFSKYDEAVFSFNGFDYKCYSVDDISDLTGDFLLMNFYALDDNIILRSRLPGDAVFLLKRNCRKTLKKLLNEMHIPADERWSVSVFYDSCGIIAVSPLTVDAKRAVDDNTSKYYVVEYKRSQHV